MPAALFVCQCNMPAVLFVLPVQRACGAFSCLGMRQQKQKIIIP
jgi:hypothetical protein